MQTVMNKNAGDFFFAMNYKHVCFREADILKDNEAELN